MTVSMIPLGIVSVQAVTNYYYKYNPDYTTFNYVNSFEEAWTQAQTSANGCVGTTADVNLSSTLSTASGKRITLELNGHKLDRNHRSSADSDCNVITVASNSTLTVYGGTKADPEPTCSNTVTVWNSSGNTTTQTITNKGVITGGRSTTNGGGIAVEEYGTCNLYYTAVSGNRADENLVYAHGYGGGVALRDNYAKLNLYGSEISYNYAEEHGGGIVVTGSAENCKINGDSDGDESTAVKSAIKYNKAVNGGGIYVDKTKVVINGLDVNNNTASTDGGGIYLYEDTAIVKNCYIHNNTAARNGGGLYNNDDDNTVENITVKNNTASGKGGGLYNDDSVGGVDIAMSGKCIIKNNGTQNLYLGYNSGQSDQCFIVNSLSKGSEVYVTYGTNHPDRLTKKPGTYDDSFFFSDTSGKYFKWFPRDSTGAHSDRHIYRVSGTKPSKATPTTINERTSSTAYTYRGEPVIKGIFEYPASVDDTIDRESTFYYSDGYFKDNAKTYNEHLASLSTALVMAAMYSSIGGVGSNNAEYRDKSNNIRQMMSDIGCSDEDIYMNDFNVRRPTDKTIGVCIASKDLPGGEKLVIIGVRGANYEAEWASNVSIGSTGEANGFKSAADTVFTELKGYLNRKKINGSDSKTKYWIAGFSRAGATANLTAKRVIDAYDTSGTRTFAYPIEAPKGALKSEATLANATGKYRCIHNILNFCDLVPWVAPGGMGFARYGVDHYVPGASSTVEPYSTDYGTVADNSLWNVGGSSYQTQKAKMLQQLAAMNDDIVYDDYFHMATIQYIEGVLRGEYIAESSTNHSGSTNMSVENWIPKFWSAFQGWGFDFNSDASATTGSSPDKQVTINTGSKIRTNFASTKIKGSKSFQEALAYVMNLLFSMEPERKEKLLSCTDGLVDRIGTTKLIGIYTNFLNTTFSGMIGSSDFDTTVEDIWTALTVLSTEDEAKGYHSIAEYLSEDELSELHSAFPALLYPILEFVSKDYNGYNQDHAGTLAYNAGRLIQNHYPEVAASWVRSYDSYYDSDTTPVTLASAAGGKEAPHYPVVEVKSAATGNVTTYSDTSAHISVAANDEVRLVPSDSNYKNTGEGIYFRYPNADSEANQGWHAFSDPIIFSDLSPEDYCDTGTSGYSYTIDTFSAHYDMAANSVATSGMTSAFDDTTRRFVFDVDRTYESGKYYTALCNVNITGNMRTDIVNIAKSQNGYMEGNNSHQLDGTISGSNNYTEYGRWYGLQDMWCAMFVSWCANKAGVSTTVIPKTASTVTALNFFKNKGLAHTRASVAAGTYKPVAGDIIFFKSGRNNAETNHIAIVTSYSGTTINTIEGNTSSATISTNGGCVRAKSYSITNTYIVYVCHPNYPSDSTLTNNVEFDQTKYDYRSWPNADTRWGDMTLGTGSTTVGNSSGISTAAAKLAVQAGLKDPAEYTVGTFVTEMNQNSGYTAAGALYWDVAKTRLGFSGVEANLMAESDNGVSFASKKQEIINWILEGKHMALSVADSKGVKSWVAVDEAMTLSTGEIYIMDGTTNLASNADVKVEDKYAALKRIACFTGGQIAYELIGSDDYRIWQKYDPRWKTTNVGGEYDVYAKGDLVIAATKLAIQADLKNPQLYNINNVVADIKKGSNGGFSASGSMYWADAAQALGFDGYNANLKASGSYSSTGTYSEIVDYINTGKHMVILVDNKWVAVDEARTLERGAIWVWRCDIDAVANGEKTGDNMCELSSISANYSRVACFTGGKTKTSQYQYVFLPGDFNGWKQNRPMTKRSDGKYEKTIYLPAGNYEFKIIDDGYWHGNQGTIADTTETTSPGIGWEFPGEDYGGNHNCTLSATGGYYTFTYAAGGYSDHPYYLVITHSLTPPQLGNVGPVVDSGAEDYRKWNITDTRWANASLNKTDTAVMSNSVAGYGDLYVAGAKMMIATGKATPETIDPGKLAALTRTNSNSGVFDWDDFASASGLTKENASLLTNGEYETRLGGKTDENTGKTLKQFILEDNYHLFIKIDDFSGGYGWALVDEAMTASATGGEIYVWLSKSTSSKSTDDNPVLLSSISTTFKRVAAFSGGNNIVQATFSGDNGAEVTGEYSYCGMTAEINSGDYVPYGAAVTVKGTPAEDYEYDEWTHNLGANPDIITSASSFSYTATAAASVTFKTKSKTGSITYSPEVHFTYAAGKPESADPDASVSFTITPDTDYIATVFVEDSSGNLIETTKSNNTYTFTMPSRDVNVSVEMQYEDYRTWSKSDSRWADTTLGTSSKKVKGTTVGMGDLVVAVTKLSKQAGSNIADVNAAVTKLNAGGGLGSTGYLDWLGTVNSDLGFTDRNVYNTNGSSMGKAAEIVAGIGEGKHYVIKVNNTVGWVAVDETLTLLTGEIYVMRSSDNADENADVRLADLSSTFSNYAYFTGGSTPTPTKRTITFSGSSHIAVTASYSIGGNTYSLTSDDEVNDGITVRFTASADPSYEFNNWSCTGVTPDQQDTAELVVTATADVSVSCTEKAKDSADTNVPLRIKYCYKDYDPSRSDTFEYQEGNEYLYDKTVYSKNTYTIAASDFNDPAVLRQKVYAGMPRLNSDYLNYSRDIGEEEDFTSDVEYDYTVDAYVVSVDMESSVRQYTVTVNSGAGTNYHFQEQVTLDASDYSVSGAVWLDGTTVVAIGDTYTFRVTGDTNLTVRAKTEEDPDSLEGTSVIIPTFSTVTTVGGTEICSKNFYIRNYIDIEDSSKSLIGAGVFYYLYDNQENRPYKDKIISTDATSHISEYALGFATKKTSKGTKHLYKNKETGLAYSYHNYAQDKALNDSSRMLRSPYNSGYVHYILELAMDNNTGDNNRTSYRVYSFFLYEEGGTTYAVVSNGFAQAYAYSS